MWFVSGQSIFAKHLSIIMSFLNQAGVLIAYILSFLKEKPVINLFIQFLLKNMILHNNLNC